VDRINLFNQSYLGSSNLKSDETIHNWKLGAYDAQSDPLHMPSHVQEKLSSNPAVKLVITQELNPILSTPSSSDFQSTDPRIRLYSQVEKLV
jgi:hypothetical protein